MLAFWILACDVRNLYIEDEFGYLHYLFDVFKSGIGQHRQHYQKQVARLDVKLC